MGFTEPPVVKMFVKIFVCIFSLIVVSTDAGPARELLEINPEEEITDALGKIWGGQCYSDSDCVDLIAYCDKDHGLTVIDGECRIVWWIWLIAAFFVLFIIISCLGCICLPCCCLYNCCSAIIDCLCCCCSSRRGYTVARSN